MLDKIIDDKERVIWTGKPDFILYVLGTPFIYIFAILWGMFDYFFFRSFFYGFGSEGFQEFNGFGMIGGFFSIFMLLHLTPVWIAILGPIYRVINYHTIEYAITDRRVYLISGTLGRDVTNIEYRHIKDLTVNVGVLENIRKKGTIQLTPNYVVYNSSRQNYKKLKAYRFISIEKPYDVYKLLKKVSLDVTTDQQYPNSYRPEKNTGYNTKLENGY